MLDLEPPPSSARAHLSPASVVDALPPQPRNVRETGLELQQIVELIAKVLYVGGRTHLPVLIGKLRLSINVLREALDFMIAEQLAEVAWRGESDIDVQYQLSGAGKQRAGAWLEHNRYTGPAPVTLDAYCGMVERQAAQLSPVPADELAAELAEGHLAPAMHAQLGAAMYSGRSMLLYGPPGSGKTWLARKLGRLLQGLVAVPYAVAVGQEIVQVYDPSLHLAPPPRQALLVRQALERRGCDSRWVLCQRPLVSLGAELSADMLIPQFDAVTGSYQAPPHLRANNGLLVIDDLGRQRMSAAEVLNRYLPPLDAGQDPLSLQGGYKFAAPFRMLLMFVTNLAPDGLLDAAALRRLAYKIEVGALSESRYRSLLRELCHDADIAFDEAALHYLVEQLHAGSGEPLLASYPRDILGRIADFAGFAGEPARLTEAALDQAWISMFAACGAAGDAENTVLCERIA